MDIEIKNPKIFFIVGTGRCGSQMLSKMLEKYSGVYIAPESHFIPVAIEELGLSNVSVDDFLDLIQRDRDWRDGKPWIEQMIRKSSYCDSLQGLSKRLHDKFPGNSDLKEILNEVFLALGGHKLIIGDKTPFYGCFMSSLLQIWPEAKFIYLTRHPDDCSKSMQRHPGFRRIISIGGDAKSLTRYRYGSVGLWNTRDNILDIQKAKSFWRDINNEILEEREKNPNASVLIVRYEDLIAWPMFELSKIESFLGLKKQITNRFLAAGIPKINFEFKGTYPIDSKDDSILSMARKLNYPVETSNQERKLHVMNELIRLPGNFFENFNKLLFGGFNKVQRKLLKS